MDSQRTYRRIAFGSLLGLLLFVAGQMIQPFVPALLWATVLSILTFPIFARLEARLAGVRLFKDGRGSTVASLLVTLGTLFIICVPFLLIALGLFLQLGGVAGGLDNGLTFDSAIARIDEILMPIADRIGADAFSLSAYVKEHQQEIVKGLTQPLKAFAGQAGLTILTLVFALLTQFFLLRDSHRLLRPTLELSPIAESRTREILAKVSATVKAVFVGTVLVALIQGAVIGVTYWAVGVQNALLLGVVSAVLCIIPLLGAPVIYIPVGIFLLSQGKTTEAAVVLGVGFVIVSQIDNVIKPFLIGGQVNLHPMAIFFAILGGVVVFGPIGVMAGPMLLTVLLGLQDVLREVLRNGQQITNTDSVVN